MATENKVRFGLTNVHYAVLTETLDETGNTTYRYGTPKRIRGAVSLSLNSKSENSDFYADNIDYYAQYQNNGYDGTLEVAEIPESMWTEVFGMTKDASGVYVESVEDVQKDVALLYQISGDTTERGYLLYKVSLGKPDVGGKTIEGKRDPQTYSMSLTATARGDGKLRANTGSDASAALKTWFDSVYETA